ncbi:MULTISPECIES: alpha-2-macroglobulin family protein [unclassified Microcoleus]|uniref:alpha-2-macroglobulin family protein n=1 Tax=unclassified Microcoleus TaxID=2642155 RepID=UPI00403FBF3B
MHDWPDRANEKFLPRTDFADVAYCGIVRADELGKAEVSFKLPDAITSYNIEAFALSQSGKEWCSVKKRLEVYLPI